MARFLLLVLAFLTLIFWLDPHAPEVSLSSVGRVLGPDPIVMTRVPYRSGDHVTYETKVSLDLTAELPFVNQPVDYDLDEEEILEVDLLGGDPADAHLAFPRRRQITVAPIVGRKVRERRVEGREYLLDEGPDGIAVSGLDGATTPEKEARFVRWAWDVVGGAPPLQRILPAEPLTIGQRFTVQGDAAKRLLGLGLEEIQADSLELVVVGPVEDGLLRFDVTASLSGGAEVAGQQITLSATLSGRLLASLATTRMVQLELTGNASIAGSGGEDGAQASGAGPLTIWRQVSTRRDD